MARPEIPLGGDPDSVYAAVVAWAESEGLSLYPHQDEAVLEIVTGAHVIVSTPTGSGKSLIATAAHVAALAAGRRTFYTAPIKALVSEKFFALCAVFGADKVGMLTGDASVNPHAPVICCTAEVLANLALRGGSDPDAEDLGIGQVVMDEFHFYAEPDRGWAWQVPLLTLPGTQFVLMSATLGDVSWLQDDLTRRTGRPTAVVTAVERPVPLTFSFSMQTLPAALTELLETHHAPLYIVHFTQASAAEQAQALTSLNIATRAQKDAIAEALGAFRFSRGFGQTLMRLVRQGIGVHHAGMLPRYRRLVETLAQQGLLRVICGTDTLGVGINVPIRTVVLTSLSKYDGERTRLLRAREFHQIAGRAGRAGYDTAGTVVVQAPEHVIDNARTVAKIGDDPKKLKKLRKKKPPEGTVTWAEPTFERLVNAEPETLTSSFRVTHSMLLNVLARPGDPVEHMRALLTDNHEAPSRRRHHIRTALRYYRSLRDAGVIRRLDTPMPDGCRHVLAAEVNPDLALNQPLSPFALAALELLDPEAPGYALDAISVVESTLDDPMPVLRAQRSKAKGELVAELKAQGMEYEERMAILEDVTWPRPLGELLDGAFEVYRQTNPWVGDFELSPKGVVRDMVERAMTFSEIVAFYGLGRSEGVVLRYLSSAWKALRQTVPDHARTDELDDLVEWLGETVRQTDSSLVDEWELMVAPVDAESGLPVLPPEPPGITRNVRAFGVAVRNAMFRRAELMALWRPDLLAETEADLPAGSGLGLDGWTDAVRSYHESYPSLGTGPQARSSALLLVSRESEVWRVQQILDDPEGDHDWRIVAEVDLAASDEAGEPVVRVTAVGPVSAWA